MRLPSTLADLLILTSSSKSHGSALSLGGIRAPEHRHVVGYTIMAESADATGCVAQIGHTQHDIVLRDSSV
jgi:hypothetical protein